MKSTTSCERAASKAAASNGSSSAGATATSTPEAARGTCANGSEGSAADTEPAPSRSASARVRAPGPQPTSSTPCRADPGATRSALAPARRRSVRHGGHRRQPTRGMSRHRASQQKRLTVRPSPAGRRPRRTNDHRPVRWQGGERQCLDPGALSCSRWWSRAAPLRLRTSGSRSRPPIATRSASTLRPTPQCDLRSSRRTGERRARLRGRLPR